MCIWNKYCQLPNVTDHSLLSDRSPEMNWGAVELTDRSLEIPELDAYPGAWPSERVKTRWHPYSVLDCNWRFRTTWRLYTLPAGKQEIKEKDINS